MERQELFHDVLDTTQRSIPSNPTDTIPEPSSDLVAISFFNNPAYSRNKPPQTNTTYGVPKAKKRGKRNEEEFQVEQLLALAELRYLEDTSKLQMAILNAKRLYAIGLVGTMTKVRIQVIQCQALVQRAYLLKWRHRVKEAVSRDVQTTVVHQSYFFSLLSQLNRRLTLKAFLIFYERGVTSAVERRMRPKGVPAKLSKYVPPPPQTSSTKQRMQEIGLGNVEPSNPKRERLDEDTRREFQRALKQRHYQERQLLERLGDSRNS